VIASTYGQGNAGNINVTAKNAVFLTGQPTAILSTVEAGGVGKGGTIDINAGSLSLQDGAQLTTITRDASTTQPAGQGDAGTVKVKVSGAVDIAGKKDTFPSGIRSAVEAGTKGNGGNITIDAGFFSLRDGAELTASTAGTGNAGNVKVTAKNHVSLAGKPTAISSRVEAGGVGNGGTIDINAGSVSLKDDAQLQGVTYGTGNAGNIKVTAKDNVSLVDGDILSTVEAGAVGKGGTIEIDADLLSIKDGAQILTITRGATTTQPAGRGNAGNIKVKVSGAVDISGQKDGIASAIFSFVDTGAKGNGGNITIDAGSFSLRDSAQLQASTYGIGNAGNVIVTAKEAVSLTDASIFSQVGIGGVGKGGTITINASSLSLKDGAQLLAVTRGASANGASGKGNAGNVNVKVSGAIDIAGSNDSFFSGIRSAVETGTEGNGGNITIDTRSISLQDGAFLEASTFGTGNAGNVKVTAKDAIALTDANIFSTVERGGVGKGGNIDINAGSLSLKDSAQLQTITRGTSITNPLFGEGDAGNINIKVAGGVDISGTKDGLVSLMASVVGTGTKGNGGNITIDAGSLSLRDGAFLAASTFGTGNAGAIKVNTSDFVNLSGKSDNSQSGLFVTSLSLTGSAGDIIVTSPKITVDGGIVSAASLSGNGGNITIGGKSPSESGFSQDSKIDISKFNPTELLLLRRGGSISTNAEGTAQEGGNGGNININSNLIVALPKENSDISANAVKGKGGNVNIDSQGLFGIQFRAQPSDGSDITASSTFGQSGIVSIDTPGTDPGRDKGELKAAPNDASNQISQACSASQRDNKFYIIGRGGHPPNAEDPLTSEVVWHDPRVAKTQPVASNMSTQTTRKLAPPAVGWVFDGKGKVTLIAAHTEGSPTRTKVICPNDGK
jgi:large exoprotein involved in heme utilization and adhesion